MSCAHLEAIAAGCDPAFTVDASRVTFGPGALGEVGARTRAYGATRVALVTDRQLRALPWCAEVEAALRAAGLDVAIFDEVAIEPTDAAIELAVRFARDARPDAYVSLGGGSVIDTAKLANLLATHPAPLLDYVNAPIGGGRAVPGPLAPHVACPTTSGTGSEVTGIAIFALLSGLSPARSPAGSCPHRGPSPRRETGSDDRLALHAKTGVASPRLRPSEAVVDPRVTATLPRAVVAASGLDVLCHALESYTARPSVCRAAPAAAADRPAARPMSQGANRWSDLGCREALRLLGAYLVRAADDAGDDEARSQVLWASTLAGIAFGNAGVHAPHAMAYAVAGRVRDYRPAGYPPAQALVPHGFAVAVNAPAVFARIAAIDPARHLEAAALLGADVRGAGASDAGAILAAAIAGVMRALDAPNGLRGVGYGEGDLDALVAGAAPQRRLLDNAPVPVDPAVLATWFHDALSCW